MTIAERVKQIRKSAGLTQQEFADRVRLKRNTIATIEGGKATSDQTLSAICREFNVNEAWLRDGIGEPYTELSWEEEVSRFVFSTFQSETDNFKKALLHVLTKLTPDQWETLGDIAEQLYLEQEKQKNES